MNFSLEQNSFSIKLMGLTYFTVSERYKNTRNTRTSMYILYKNNNIRNSPTYNYQPSFINRVHTAGV